MLVPFAAVCVWGIMQLAARWSVVRSATVGAVLYWLAAGCLAWLGWEVTQTRSERLSFLRGALVAGSVVCLLGLVQLFTSDGRVFWMFSSGYETDVIGPFVSRNNYAAFVELLLPLALALSFQDRRHSKSYLVLAAALFASVVASGSRAGAILVTLEAAVVFLSCARLPARRDSHPGLALLSFGVAVAVFVAVCGHQFLWDRFSQDTDPYRLRREFLESSIAMVRAQPWHGFGLGTWTSVYPQFAIIDPGTRANHAHNEWIQWAAEGGLPCLVLIAGATIWLLRPAVRSVWGLGIVSVMIHSWVDYPFMRLGMAAWIFAFLGVLAASMNQRPHIPQSRPVVRGLACAAIPALLLAVFAVGRLAYADFLYSRATLESVTRASALDTGDPDYPLALAQLDPDHAADHLRRALDLNPYLTHARIALAAELETGGNIASAEAMLLEAARRDKLYAPAWALANFYLRNDRPELFWEWSRRAAWLAYDDLTSLLDLCFHRTDDAGTVMRRVVTGKRSVERQYLTYLIQHQRLADAHAAAMSMAATAADADRDLLLAYVDRSLEAARGADAVDIWNHLCSRRLLPYAVAPAGTLVNGDFRQPILQHGFDWILPESTGITQIQTREGGAALEIAFSGKQNEACQLLQHFVWFATHSDYVLRFQYRTDELPAETGLSWSVGNGPAFPLTASPDWATAEWHFQARSELGRIILAYRRSPGTTRHEGSLRLRRIELKEQSL